MSFLQFLVYANKTTDKPDNVSLLRWRAMLLYAKTHGIQTLFDTIE